VPHNPPYARAPLAAAQACGMQSRSAMSTQSHTTRSTQDLEEFYLDEIIERASLACTHVPEAPCLECLVGELSRESLEEMKTRRIRRTDGMERLLRDVLG